MTSQSRRGRCHHGLGIKEYLVKSLTGWIFMIRPEMLRSTSSSRSKAGDYAKDLGGGLFNGDDVGSA